ncbi:hypothetical protein JYK00_00240 [Thermosipho ferrireducens]|uniref:Tail specific protease domain-containing protein n=1 Tax=Thermosipho ferrireducens TaxID=2571116 RepID=A0ABX7S844_9BACT|nr:S41 family peptidase [Thermosipho ferrireducens]QTA38016.1 hypothetical protein JYK00_00240 [Thermosipho ferrireducens]
MKKKILVFFLTFLSILTFSQKLFSAEELQTDFDVFINYILKAGIDPFKFVSEETFYSKVDEIKTKLNKPMTKGEFFKTIAPMIHLFSDVHYGIVFNITTDTLVMPFEPVVVGNRLFVKNSLVEDLNNNSEVLEIDGRKVQDMIEEFRKYIPRIISKRIDLVLGHMVLLLPEIEGKDTFDLLIKNGNIEKQIQISAFTKVGIINKIKKLNLKIDKPISFERKGKIGILNIKSFSFKYERLEYYKDFLKEVFKNSKDMTDLIIDLRKNPGGYLENIYELFKYLTDKKLVTWGIEYVYTNLPGNKEIKRIRKNHDLKIEIIPVKDNFKGKVWLLVDDTMASIAVVATYLFQKFELGKIIGEKPKEPVNTLSVRFSTNYILPNTELSLLIPNGKYYFEEEPKIVIDYERKMTEKEEIDYLLGERDVVLDYAFEIISKS